MKARYLLTSLLLVLPAATLLAAPSDAQIVATCPAAARADYDTAIRDLAGVIERDPESPLVTAAVIRLNGLRALAVDENPVTDRLLAVVKKGIADGRNDQALRDYLRKRLRERGELDAARELEPDAGYLLHWAVVGPFGFDARSLLDRRYEPEENLDFAKGYEETTRTRRFVLLPLGDDRSIDPFVVLRGSSGVAYSVAQFRAETARPAVLVFSGSGSYRAWLNGREVLRVDRLRERRSETSYAPVALAAGWNRLVVKTAGHRTGFSVKVAAPDTLKPLGDLEEETALTLHPLPEPSTSEPAGAVRPRREEFRGDDSPFAAAVRAILLENQGLDLEAIRESRAAVAARPKDPGLCCLLGDELQSANGLPDVWKKNQAKIAYGAAIEADPDCSPAIVALAALKNADDRSEDAARDLRALIEKNPKDLPAHWTLSRIAAGRGWEKEALAEARTCLDLSARFQPARAYLTSHEERYGDVAEARKLLEQTVGYWRDDFSAMRQLAGHEAAAGDVDAAISRYRDIARLWPRWTGSTLQIASLLADQGRYDEAVGMLEAAAASYPTTGFYWRRIGDVLRRKGDVPAALESYRKSLAIEPSQADLRRYIDRLEKQEDDFSLPYETEVLDLIPDAPDRKDYPRAPAVCLLDQTVLRVWPDGSSSSIVHMAYKLMDEKGVQAYGRVNCPGETLEVRTIDKAGKIWEPLGVSGGSYNMPALEAGAVVEYRYRSESGASDRGFDTGAFYFADPDYDNAVMLSRWIVILPKGFDADLILRNFHGEHTVKEEGDTVVHVFTVHKSERTETEPFMPDRDSLLPWARFLRNRPFDDVNYVHSDRLWSGLAPTPLVEEKAAEVTKGIDGDLARARALYSFVNELVTGSYSFGGPTATILEKAGDRFDLFASLLIAAGVHFDLAVTCPDHGRNVDFDVVNPGIFSDRCLRLTDEDGTAVWVFDSPRFAPFGRIPDDDRDSPVLVIGRAGGHIETLPPEPDGNHESATTAKIDLGADRASSTVDLRLEYRTDGGYGYKERIRKLDSDDRRQGIERWVSSAFTGPVLTAFDYPDLEKYGTPAVLSAQAKLPNFLQSDGEGAKCDLGIRPLNLARSYVGKPERIHPMWIRTDYGQTDRAVIDLKGKWKVVRLPSSHITMGPLGAYSLTIEEKDGRIYVTRRVRFRPVRLSKDEYPALVQWVKAIDDAETAQIRLAPR